MKSIDRSNQGAHNIAQYLVNWAFKNKPLYSSTSFSKILYLKYEHIEYIDNIPYNFGEDGTTGTTKLGTVGIFSYPSIHSLSQAYMEM